MPSDLALAHWQASGLSVVFETFPIPTSHEVGRDPHPWNVSGEMSQVV